MFCIGKYFTYYVIRILPMQELLQVKRPHSPKPHPMVAQGVYFIFQTIESGLTAIHIHLGHLLPVGQAPVASLTSPALQGSLWG